MVDEINHMPDKVQAETIAYHISAVSQEYEHLENNDIKVPDFQSQPYHTYQ